MENKGQTVGNGLVKSAGQNDNFVFEKSIFSNIFDKDIRRVYIYKKAERLARAIHLVAPAFGQSEALKERAESLAVILIDGAVMAPQEAKLALSRALLSLSSLLGVARTGGLLSPMNAELIAREAQQLLQEVAAYEEPRVSFDVMPTLAEMARTSTKTTPEQRTGHAQVSAQKKRSKAADTSQGHKGQISDNEVRGSRRDHILSILRSRPAAYIKDISTTIRGVSEKTIQRELQALVTEGVITREGERRWTTYSLKQG